MATTEQELQAMKKEIAEIKSMLTEQEKGISKIGNSLPELNKQDLQQAANTAGRKVRSALNETKEEASVRKERAEETIKEHPLSSTTAAFTGGVIIATLIPALRNR
jgi:ElaB/YqjD/DUF883 family membrane-anchored ribosome-binding protein